MDVDGVYFFICWGNTGKQMVTGAARHGPDRKRIGVGLFVGACMTRDTIHRVRRACLSFLLLGGGMSLHASPQMGDEFRVQALE